jgi:hypothetical protein
MGKITDLDIIQRSIVLELLRDDQDPRWTFDQLCTEIYDVPPAAMRQAIKKLEAGQVIHTTEDPQLLAWASEGTRHLDSLGMVCI